MNNRHFNEVVHHALREAKTMAPTQGKNPLVAFFAGFLFGPFGVGGYLRSWSDFFVSLGLVILGSLMTAGVGAPFVWVLCGLWGATRAAGSKGR